MLDEKMDGSKLALAKASAVSHTYVYRVLNAKCSPTIDTLARFAAALDVDVAEMFATDS